MKLEDFEVGIYELPDESVKKLKKLSGKTNITWANPPKTKWILLFLEKHIAGCLGLALNSKRKNGRIKSIAVGEKYRGIGLYYFLLDTSFSLAKKEGMKTVDIFCNENSYPGAVKKGFELKNEITRKNGRITRHLKKYL